MRFLLASVITLMGLSACESFTPYDYDDPGNKRQQERKSCDRDPYQDQCQPGGFQAVNSLP